MGSLSSLWQRVPVAVRAVVVGLLVAAAGTFPWAWLARSNLRHGSSVPWGAGLMAGYLWAYWSYLTGRWGPPSTRAARRTRARANAISAEVWGRAILAGVLGLWASIILIRLIGRLVLLPTEQAGDLSAVPMPTLLSMAVMGAFVAGVVEEIAFRGYMQRPLENRLGAPAALLIVGAMFGLAHGTHTEWTVVLMPYYLAVAATYGALAWITDSIMPSLVLHAGGDLLGALALVIGGTSELGSAPGTGPTAPSGVHMRFWINLLVLFAVTSAAVWAYRRLAVAVSGASRDFIGERGSAAKVWVS